MRGMISHPHREPLTLDNRDPVERIDSALEAAECAEEELEAAEDLLRDALGAGQIGLAGAGILVDRLGRGRMDAACAHVAEARYWVAELERDIGPIGSELSSVEVERLMQANHVLVDLLVVDPQRASRIADALDSIRIEMRELAALQTMLFAERKRRP